MAPKAPNAIALADYCCKVFCKGKSSDSSGVDSLPELHDISINSDCTVEMLKQRIISELNLPKHVQVDQLTVRHNAHRLSNDIKVGHKFPLEYQYDDRIELNQCVTAPQFATYLTSELMVLAVERGITHGKSPGKASLIEMLLLEQRQGEVTRLRLVVEEQNARIRLLEQENMEQQECILMFKHELENKEHKEDMAKDEQLEQQEGSESEQDQFEEEFSGGAAVEQIDAPVVKGKKSKKNKK